MAERDGTDELLILADDDPEGTRPGGAPWKVLIVDDDPEVHMITRTVLGKVRFQERDLCLLSAHTEADARQALIDNPDTAIILLDVVMEREDAGLRLIHHIRRELNNHAIRIILRTGQPGQAPERDVIVSYDINDYKAKTELTAQKLFTMVIAALRAFADIRNLELSQARLREANAALERRVAQRTQALARSNAELESFAYGISHDLQEPLRMVRSYLQLIERRLGPALDEETAEYLGFAINGAARMGAMIHDLLDYSRLATKPMDRKAVSLRRALGLAIDKLALSIQETKARITLPEHDGWVEGDANQIARLFQNLIGNALKHRQPRRAPVVRISLRAAQMDDGTTAWHLVVADEGPGIPPDSQETIFSLFHRLDPLRTSGTGVGLALCRRIVEYHGGRLWVESAEGEGAAFQILIPACAEPKAEPEAEKKPA